MSKIKKLFSCTNCGSMSNKWLGQCPDCNQWGSIAEELASSSKILAPKTGVAQKLDLLSDAVLETIRTTTPIEELKSSWWWIG